MRYPTRWRSGRHEPGALARGIGEALIIGEAKCGPDLIEERAFEQFEDFTHHLDERTALVLVLPGEFREQAERALRDSGADVEWVSVIAINLPSPILMRFG